MHSQNVSWQYKFHCHAPNSFLPFLYHGSIDNVCLSVLCRCAACLNVITFFKWWWWRHKHFWNGQFLTEYILLHPRCRSCSYLLPWEPEISLNLFYMKAWVVNWHWIENFWMKFTGLNGHFILSLKGAKDFILAFVSTPALAPIHSPAQWSLKEPRQVTRVISERYCSYRYSASIVFCQSHIS